jgi:hypothetical protein
MPRSCAVVGFRQPGFRLAKSSGTTLTRLLARQLPSRTFWSRMRFFTARQRLIWFNDYRHTRHEEIIALFDRTIDKLTRDMPVCVSR